MIFYCICNDLDKRPDKGVMGSSMLQVPESMISLDLLMAASSFVDKWGLVDVGQLGPAARAGSFIPDVDPRRVVLIPHIFSRVE